MLISDCIGVVRSYTIHFIIPMNQIIQVLEGAVPGWAVALVSLCLPPVAVSLSIVRYICLSFSAINITRQTFLLLSFYQTQYMTRMFKHLIRIIKHKYWVAYYCFQLGLYWQGIVHDWSKFSYTEFSRSIKYWDDTISPLANEKNIHGYSETFLHHRGRNPHHYEYWVHSLDEGGVPAKMPRKYALELVCDYLAAGRTYNKDFTYGSEYNWWIKFLSSPRAIHPETKDFVTKCFRHLSAGGNIKYLLKIDYE